MKKLVLFVAIGLTACGTGKKQGAQPNPAPENTAQKTDTKEESPKIEESKPVDQKENNTIEKKQEATPGKVEEKKSEVKAPASSSTQPAAPKYLIAKIAEGSSSTADESQVSYSFSSSDTLTMDSHTSSESDFQPTVRGEEFRVDSDDATFWHVYRPWSLVNRLGRALFGPSPRFFAYLSGVYGCGYSFSRGYVFNGFNYSFYEQSGCAPIVPNCPLPVFGPVPAPLPIGGPVPLPAGPVGVPGVPVGVPGQPIGVPGQPVGGPAPLPAGPVGVPGQPIGGPAPVAVGPGVATRAC